MFSFAIRQSKKRNDEHCGGGFGPAQTEWRRRFCGRISTILLQVFAVIHPLNPNTTGAWSCS